MARSRKQLRVFKNAKTVDMETISVVSLIEWLAKNTPTRTSIRQLYAFVLIANADAQGAPINLTAMKLIGGEDVYGEPLFSSSVNRSYNIFFDPEVVDDTLALSWVKFENDRVDRRIKYLRLTPKGKQIFDKLKKMAA